MTIPDTNDDRVFLDSIRQTFAHDPDFLLKETRSLTVRIEPASPASHPSPDAAYGLPSNWSMSVLGDLSELAEPSIETDIIGGTGVLVRAADPVHNSDRSAIVRQALADRGDLTLTMQSDQSLRIDLVKGTPIGQPERPMLPGQLQEAVVARLKSLKIKSYQITPINAERVQVRLASRDDATQFRQALHDPSGLAIQSIDERRLGPSSTHSASDEQKRLPGGEIVWLERNPIITGNMIADAKAGTNPSTNTPDIELVLTGEGRQRFSAATAANVGHRFAIVLNGTVLSAPVIQTPISGNEVIITGNFSVPESQEIARSILSYRGELPLKIVND